MSLPASPATDRIEILEAFADLPDGRHSSGKPSPNGIVLSPLYPGYNRWKSRVIAIGDWLNSYRHELIDLFHPPKDRLPSYSTIRRVLLSLDYQAYSAALARFFGIEPLPGETLAMDGKVLRGSYQL